MEFLLAITHWCVLGPTCKVDWVAWSAIGTCLAAAATLGAIWVALSSSNREHARTLQLRNADIELAAQLRGEAQERERVAVVARTARLARAFHDDLSRAAQMVRVAHDRLISCLQGGPAEAEMLNIGASQVQRGMEYEGFILMKRFADDLDGFTEIDGIAILNMLSNWAHINPMPLEWGATKLSTRNKQFLIEKRVRDYREITTLMRELGISLEKYFQHLPELTILEHEPISNLYPAGGGG